MTTPGSSLEDRAEKYAHIGATYDQVTYGQDHLQLYRDMRNEEIARILAESFPGCSLRVLEVGCGTGAILEFLAGLGQSHTLLGVDASETMLEQARQRAHAKHLSIEFQQASCDRLPVDDASVDVVLATRFIHLFPHAEKMRIYREFRRVVRAGGILVVEYYARPYAGWRYYLGGESRRKPKREFFDHYPTAKEVREIVGGAFQRRPVRLAGARALLRLLGPGRLRPLTRRAASIPGLNLLVDEYLVVTKN